MIKKLLIANRGEIACRIMRTAKKMGIKTVAVYSEADKNALHVKKADEAYCIGESAPQNSYLNIVTIMKIAKKTRVTAIHPGYGFLSESAHFSKTVSDEGILFIGAPTTAIAIMGSKAKSKQLMQKEKIPLLPGFESSEVKHSVLQSAAKKIGYPILLKASAGGGGKGMRIVYSEETLLQEFTSAQREAKNAFADSHIIIERYLKNPRHIEVQVFFDQQGNGVYLFDRDCSLQRRYQKIIEEAPAPYLSNQTHQALGNTAIQAARAVDYVGAGTVEFLLDSKNQFYFMEMNTRLQVEHPVTEMITNTDLVEWQIRVACGEPLPWKQHDIIAEGHAIEVRLYAENPSQSFAPVTGKIKKLRWPEHNETRRIETGIIENDSISSWYDPMIAKLVGWGKDRRTAIENMTHMLQNTYLTGIMTNRDLLITLLLDSRFLQGKIHTSFVEATIESLLQKDPFCKKQALIAASYYRYRQNASMVPGWRLNESRVTHSLWCLENSEYHVKFMQCNEKWRAEINNEAMGVFQCFQKQGQRDVLITVHQNSQSIDFVIFDDMDTVTVISDENTVTLSTPIYDETRKKDQSYAPMNGRVVAIHVETGAHVREGDIIMVVEAMKMEVAIKADKTGVINQLFFNLGDTVDEGCSLFSYLQEDA